VILPDVNVLVEAFRNEREDHTICRTVLVDAVASDHAYGISELALSAFVRIVTNPRIFDRPSTLEEALVFAAALTRGANAVRIGPGPRHWDIFTRLCREAHVKGDVVTDAYFAALAIEHGCEWITLDSDFARFPGLKWRRPG
jgi:toxin-antitoxin system PIN domain toxin